MYKSLNKKNSTPPITTPGIIIKGTIIAPAVAITVPAANIQ